MKVVLELQDQPSNVRRITVRHDIVIGRGSDCNLRLSAPQISRRHCFLRVGRDSVSVTDLDSSNGTFIDGKRITSGKRHDLSDGSELSLGPIRFLIHVQEESTVSRRVKSEVSPETSAHQELMKQTAVASDASAHAKRVSANNPKSPMDYAVEHGGNAAEDHDQTADCIEDGQDNAVQGKTFPLEPPIEDSRLEIIDFGRQIKKQQGSEEDESAPDEDMSRWTSMTEGSSDQLDVFSIPEDEDLAQEEGFAAVAQPRDRVPDIDDHSNVDELHVIEDLSAGDETLEAGNSLDNNSEIVDVVEYVEEVPVEAAHWEADESDIVEVYDVELDEIVDVVQDDAEETSEPETVVVSRADAVTNENADEEDDSNWFGNDTEERRENHGDKDIDDELRDFLKGF